MLKVLSLLLGFMMMVIGMSYMIIYLNLLSFGYSFWEYLIYIFTHKSSLFTFFGLLIVGRIVLKKEKKHDIYK